MCGIAGYWGGNADAEIVSKMGTYLSHRGPDKSGSWIDPDTAIALTHSRLAVIDCTEAGYQPMISRDGRYVLVFNGEIYNHRRLRKEMEIDGVSESWRGHSDTETLLVGLNHWGVEVCLSKLVGMFAFGLWDRVKQILILARDRMGEKPLYYGSSGGVFLFGSELKSFAGHPSWQPTVDRDSLNLFFKLGYIPTPISIYCDTYKLPPGHFIQVKNGIPDTPVSFWNLASVSMVERRNLGYTPDQLVDQLQTQLTNTISDQMIADVPLGIFLSGGYDSSLISAIAQSISRTPVKTFSLGFHNIGFDEAVHARNIASFLGSNHTELYIDASDALQVVPLLGQIYDEPFADFSQIPTYLVSKLARDEVTVCLSGDGGDELFCGYNRYTNGYKYWSNLSSLPAPAKTLLAATLRLPPAHFLNFLQSIIPRLRRRSNLSEHLIKLANSLKHADGSSYYQGLMSHWKNSANLVLGSNPSSVFPIWYEQPNLLNLQEKMMYWDSVSYLPDDILTKVDRASMAVSLEVRVPFLDHRLVEFAWQVPLSHKYKNGQGKWLLKQLLARYVPMALIDRPKMGFGVPIGEWLRKPLRDWAESLLDESRLREEGFLNAQLVRQVWQDHLVGRSNRQHELWTVLMFQSWLENQKVLV